MVYMVKTIRVSEETHEMLSQVTKKTESYDEGIKRILDFYISCEGGMYQ